MDTLVSHSQHSKQNKQFDLLYYDLPKSMISKSGGTKVSVGENNPIKSLDDSALELSASEEENQRKRDEEKVGSFTEIILLIDYKVSPCCNRVVFVNNPYLCSICGLGFVIKSSLYNHRMCHKNQKQHK